VGFRLSFGDYTANRVQPAGPIQSGLEPVLTLFEGAMKRHSKKVRGPVKTRRRKINSAKAAGQQRGSSVAGQETTVARLTRELKEARERQRATAEVLSAISRSTFELQSVLQIVVDTASQLCRADTSVIFRLEGGVYHFAAGYSLDPAYLEHERRTPISPGPGTVVGRAAMSREVVQIEDAWTDPLYEQKAAIKNFRRSFDDRCAAHA
jgi:hypothetical protein